MYTITNKTKANLVFLTGQRIAPKLIKPGQSIDLDKDVYTKYAQSIDVLFRIGEVSVSKKDSSETLDTKHSDDGDLGGKISQPDGNARIGEKTPEKPSNGFGVESPQTKSEDLSYNSLSAMTVADLIPIATSMGIVGTGLKKEALIKAILDSK